MTRPLAAAVLLLLAACERSFDQPARPTAPGAPLQAISERSQVAPLGTAHLTASGGRPGYHFRVEPADGEGSGGQVADDGTYQAGPRGERRDRVVVSDQAGAEVQVEIAVGQALRALPEGAQVAPGQGLVFTAQGGQPPYRFRFARHGNRSGGELAEVGLYQAGPNAEVGDRLEVEDANGATAVVLAQVGQPTYDLGGAFQELFAANFNGDAYADLLATPRDGLGETRVLLGGPQGLTPSTVWRLGADLIGADRHGNGVSAGDADGDGRDDLLLQAFAYTGTELYLYRGGLGGELSPQASVALEPGQVTAILMGPGQGMFPALALGGADPAGGGRVVFYDVRGASGDLASDGGALPLPELGALSLPGVPYYLAARNGALTALLEGDGCRAGGGLSVYTARGLTSPGDQPVASTACVTGCTSDCLPALGLADLDGNGLMDRYLALLSPEGAGRLEVGLGRIDGSEEVQPALTLPPAVALAVEAQPGRMQGSVGPPEALDLVGLEQSARMVWVDGGPTVSDAGLPGDSYSAAGADFDGDGLGDLALASVGGSLQLLPGKVGDRPGGNRFRLGGTDTREVANAAAATDLDGDGLTDLVVGGRGLTFLGGTPEGELTLDGTALDGQFVVGAAVVPGGALAITALPPRAVQVTQAPDGGLAVTERELPALGQVGLNRMIPAPGGALLDLVQADGSRTWALLGPDGTALAQGQLPPDTDSVTALHTAQGDMLAVVRRTGVELHPALPGGGWAADVAQTLPASALAGGCATASLFHASSTAFALQAGQPAHALLLNVGDDTGACAPFNQLLVYDFVAGAAHPLGQSPVDPSNAPFFEVAAADLDGDGATDLVFNPSDRIELLWGDGAGGFAGEELRYALGTTAVVLPGDFDGDGRVDLGLFQTEISSVALLLNAGGRSFR